MPYGWLSQVGQGVQSDIRAVQPMKNLRLNRAILSEEEAIARDNAERRYREMISEAPARAVAPEPAASSAPEPVPARPMVTTMTAPSSPAKAWDEVNQRQRAEVAKVTDEITRNPSSDEAQKAFFDLRTKHENERAELTNQIGPEPVGSRDRLNELAGAPVDGNQKNRLGVQTESTNVQFVDSPLLQQGQQYISGSLADDQARDYRRQMILGEELGAARARALPRLQGTEGLSEFDQGAGAASAGLKQMITQAGLNTRENLKSATTLEKERMKGIITREKNSIDQEGRALDRQLKRMALGIKQGTLDQKDREIMIDAVQNSVKNARDDADRFARLAKSGEGFMRDNYLGIVVPVDDDLRSMYLAANRREKYGDLLISLVSSKDPTKYDMASKLFSAITSGDRSFDDWERAEQTKPGSGWSLWGYEIAAPEIATPGFSPKEAAAGRTGAAADGESGSPEDLRKAMERIAQLEAQLKKKGRRAEKPNKKASLTDALPGM